MTDWESNGRSKYPHVHAHLLQHGVVVRLDLDDYSLDGSHAQDLYLFGGVPQGLGHIQQLPLNHWRKVEDISATMTVRRWMSVPGSCSLALHKAVSRSLGYRERKGNLKECGTLNSLPTQV